MYPRNRPSIHYAFRNRPFTIHIRRPYHGCSCAFYEGAKGVKVAEERKEGTGARMGSKYPVSDEITDVSVMIGVYAVLALLEVSLGV